MSWPAYVVATIGEPLDSLPRTERRELGQFLTEEGLSTRAIAPLLGVGDSTVHRDTHSAAPSGAPEQPTLLDEPEPKPIAGRDGKTYRPRPVVVLYEDPDAIRQRELRRHWG